MGPFKTQVQPRRTALREGGSLNDQTASEWVLGEGKCSHYLVLSTGHDLCSRNARLTSVVNKSALKHRRLEDGIMLSLVPKKYVGST